MTFLLRTVSKAATHVLRMAWVNYSLEGNWFEIYQVNILGAPSGAINFLMLWSPSVNVVADEFGLMTIFYSNLLLAVSKILVGNRRQITDQRVRPIA